MPIISHLLLRRLEKYLAESNRNGQIWPKMGQNHQNAVGRFNKTDILGINQNFTLDN